jgi:cytoskeletal protein CcmA (bactofilin family)
MRGGGQMANWIDDLGIPMTPPRRRRSRSIPQRLVEPSAQLFAPPRVAEMPHAIDPRNSESGSPAPAVQQIAPPVTQRDQEIDAGTLIVGREVSLSGEVSSCDRLIVEGTVHAKIESCENLMIAGTGEFEGCSSSQNVDVRGRFDGDLIVKGRLLIRATGRVSGKISYKEIDIERGGRLSGEIHTLEDGGFTLDWNSRRRGSAHE